MDSLTVQPSKMVRPEIALPPVRDEIAVAELWRILRRRRSVALLVLGAALVLATVLCIMIPRRYEAVARVLVSPDKTNALGLSNLEVSGSGIAVDSSVIQETQVKVLLSSPLAWDVITKLRLDQRGDFAGKLVTPPGQGIETVSDVRRIRLIHRLHSALRVETVPKTELIEVRYRSTDPKLAAEVVNTLTSSYVERNFRTRYDATMQASEWLAKQLDSLKQRAEVSQLELTEYQKKSGIIGTDQSVSVLLGPLEELQKQVAAASADRIMREAKYRVAATGNPELMAEIVPTSTLTVLRAQQADLKNQYAQLTAKYGNAYPRVAQVRSQLMQVEGALRHELDNTRLQLKSEYEASLKSEAMINAELEKRKQDAYKLNEAGIRYAILKRDFDSSRDLYESLLKKLKEAGIIAGLKSTNIDIVDPAEVPLSPAEPRIALIFLVSIILGSVTGAGIAFLADNLDTTISTPEHAEQFAKLPVLGVVPRIFVSANGNGNGNGNGNRLHLHRHRSKVQHQLPPATRKPIALEEPNSAVAEAFRALRTTVLLASAGAPPPWVSQRRGVLI